MNLVENEGGGIAIHVLLPGNSTLLPDLPAVGGVDKTGNMDIQNAKKGASGF